MKNHNGNLKAKYDIPEYIREMPKNFSLFATMQEFAFIKNLIKKNLYDYILNELEEMKNHDLNCFTIELIDKNNLKWKATINYCHKDKKYNKSISIHINFPRTYPFDAPIIKVLSSITEKKFISTSGQVLLDTIEKWNSSLSIIDVLGEIKGILLKIKNFSVINNKNENNSFQKITMNKKDEIIKFISNKKKRKEQMNNFSDEEDINQKKTYYIENNNNNFEPIPRNNYCYRCKKKFYNYLEHIKSKEHLNSIDSKIIKRFQETFAFIVLNKNKKKINKYTLSNLSNFSETPSYLIFSDN
jgi:ubiquitin-protein ligase